MKKRMLTLDAWRGFAVLLMLIFHLAVDLEDFFGWPVGYRQGGWYMLNQVIVLLFLFVSGFAAGQGLNRHALKNGVKILAAAAVVSLATYFFDPASYVRFGILHLLACAMLLTPLLLLLGNWQLLVLALVFILLGNYLAKFTPATEIFLPFGLVPENFTTLDYYPLFPWLSFFICGIVLGRKIQLQAQANDNILLRGLAGLGRHALAIYLLHQPLFLLSLTLLLG